MIIAPPQRVEKVDGLLAALFGAEDRPARRVLDMFGTDLALEPRVAEGVVLPSALVKYRDAQGGRPSAATKTVQPSFGQWNLRDAAFCRGGSCSVWAIYSFVDMPESVLGHLGSTLVSQATKYGVALSGRPGMACYSRRSSRSAIEQFQSFLEAAKGKKCELLFVILDDRDSTNTYQRVKASGDVSFPTQCLRCHNRSVQAVLHGGMSTTG